MSATRPDALAVLLEDVRRLAAEVGHAYAWLYPSGYEARRAGQGGNGGADGADVSRVVVATDRARALLARAARKTAAAKVALGDAADALGDLADLIDEGESRELPDLAVLKALGSRAANHADGEAAATRRAARGASMPGSDYPAGERRVVVDGPARQMIADRRAV